LNNILLRAEDSKTASQSHADIVTKSSKNIKYSSNMGTIRFHALCGRLFEDYMRLRYLSPQDPPDVREQYYQRARRAHSELVHICAQYYERNGEPYADLICQSLDIYRLHDICTEALS
jgi:hypothetical protein